MKWATSTAMLAALSALACAGQMAHAAPRDITLPELLGGPDGDAIRPPDTMPVPAPTPPRLNAPPSAPPVKKPPLKAPAAAPKRPAAVAVQAKPPAKPRARAPVLAAAAPKPPPAVRQVPPPPPSPKQAAAPGEEKLAQEIHPGAAPQLSVEPAAPPIDRDAAPELAQQNGEPSATAPQSEADEQRVFAGEDGFEQRFAAIEEEIERGLRTGDLGRREASRFYAELDDIADMEDYFRRSGRLESRTRALVADRLAALQDMLSRQTRN